MWMLISLKWKKLFSALKKKKKKAANLVAFDFYDIAKVLNVV